MPGKIVHGTLTGEFGFAGEGEKERGFGGGRGDGTRLILMGDDWGVGLGSIWSK